MSKQGSLIGNIAFWLLVLSASAGAFAAGFFFTFGATLDVHTKTPAADSAPKLGAFKSPLAMAVKPSPTATPVVPGPLPVTSLAPTPAPRKATPTPMAMIGGIDEPSATPYRTRPTATPVPMRTPAPTPKEEIYRVQVGAFDSRESAQKQVDELQQVGINAVVVYDGGSYHAQLGAFSDRARAISVADEVNTRGYSVTIRH